MASLGGPVPDKKGDRSQTSPSHSGIQPAMVPTTILSGYQFQHGMETNSPSSGADKSLLSSLQSAFTQGLRDIVHQVTFSHARVVRAGSDLARVSLLADMRDPGGKQVIVFKDREGHLRSEQCEVGDVRVAVSASSNKLPHYSTNVLYTEAAFWGCMGKLSDEQFVNACIGKGAGQKNSMGSHCLDAQLRFIAPLLDLDLLNPGGISFRLFSRQANTVEAIIETLKGQCRLKVGYDPVNCSGDLRCEEIKKL